jgi:hypothetical protein
MTNEKIDALIERLRKRNTVECTEAADVIEALLRLQPTTPAPKPRKPRAKKTA